MLETQLLNYVTLDQISGENRIRQFFNSDKQLLNAILPCSELIFATAVHFIVHKNIN